ncbi:MAG TPA: 50S ribosomal protein L25/general stress protein Ctc [Gammaproteobacteria bacterium]|nr:50S ribosomal protein L25/general stress protein Ctc [Gammaproteobacteria bacterium]
MAIKFELEAEVRGDVGKGASRRLRHTDKVPAVVYGGGEKSVSLTLDHNKTLHALSHEAFYSHILNLTIGKNTEKVILKDVQRDPAKPRIAHVDFLRVRADQKLHMRVPLHFTGEENAPGLKEGGVFSHLMTDAEVSCLPADLPEFIEVDVSGMMLDQTLHLSDLKLGKGVELVVFAQGVEGHDQPVVSIHIPRIIEEEVVEAAPEEGEAAESAEGAAEENAAETKGNE